MKLLKKQQNNRIGLSPKLLLLIVVIFFAGFAVDLFCQRKVLLLPEQEKGVISLGRRDSALRRPAGRG